MKVSTDSTAFSEQRLLRLNGFQGLKLPSLHDVEVGHEMALLGKHERYDDIDALLDSAPNLTTILTERPMELRHPHPNIRTLISMSSHSPATVTQLPGLRVASLHLAPGVLSALPETLRKLRGRPPFEMREILRFPDLEYLDTGARGDLRALEGLKHLQVLRLSGVRGRPQVFGKLKALQELALDGSTWPSLKAFAGLGSLRRFEIAVDGDLEDIRGLEWLESLTLGGRRCPQLSPLRGLPRLRELSVMTESPAVDIDDICELRELRVLRIFAGTITSLSSISSVKAFRGLSGLEVLDCRNSRVLDPDLLPLGELRHLRYVAFAGTYAADTIERLRQLSPNCEFDLTVGRDDGPEGKNQDDLVPARQQDAWEIFADLSARLGQSSNHEVEAIVKGDLAKSSPELLGRLDFDSEAGAFCVRAKSRADVDAVVAIIRKVEKDRRQRGGHPQS